jgi:hypothetical protein
MGMIMAFVLTGAAINPARAFGPQLVANHWGDDWWVWYVGPFAGGVIAAVLYELMYLRPSEPPGITAQAATAEPLSPDEPAVVDTEDTVAVVVEDTVDAPRWPAQDEPPRTAADE